MKYFSTFCIGETDLCERVFLFCSFDLLYREECVPELDPIGSPFFFFFLHDHLGSRSNRHPTFFSFLFSFSNVARCHHNFLLLLPFEFVIRPLIRCFESKQNPLKGFHDHRRKVQSKFQKPNKEPVNSWQNQKILFPPFFLTTNLRRTNSFAVVAVQILYSRKRTKIEDRH